MNVVYAIANATTHRGGVPISIAVGQHWPADDPIVAEFPSMFSSDARYGLVCSVIPDEADAADAAAKPPIEQTTAAPGEKRTTTRG